MPPAHIPRLPRPCRVLLPHAHIPLPCRPRALRNALHDLGKHNDKDGVQPDLGIRKRVSFFPRGQVCASTRNYAQIRAKHTARVRMLKRGRPRSSDVFVDGSVSCSNNCSWVSATDLHGRKCRSCGAPLTWTCATCGRLLSLSNRAKGHKCAPQVSVGQAQVSPGATLRFLFILRPGHSLAVVPPRLLDLLPRALLERNSIGENLTEEYNIVMLHLRILGHLVRFMTRTEWNELLFSNPTRWQRELSDIDVILDGYWPYDETKDHVAVRSQLDELLSVLNVRLCPTPSDTLFAAHKCRYHASLQRVFGDKQIVIPSVYLASNSSIEVIRGAVSTLASSSLVLKRGLSESSEQVYFLEESSTEANIKQIYRVLTSTAGKVATLWLLQPFIAEFTTQHELKLYFDLDGHLLVAFANIILPKKRGAKETDVEVLELRRDIPQQWLDHRVDEALAVASRVRREIVRVAPSLAPLLRIDLIHTDRWGFLVNEIEHFGDTWLQLQRTSSTEYPAAVAQSILRYEKRKTMRPSEKHPL